MPLKIAFEEIKRRAALKGFILLSEYSNGARIKLKWQCNNGHTFIARPESVWTRGGCMACRKNSEKLNIDDVRDRGKLKGLVLISSDYKNMRQKLEWRCEFNHHIFLNLYQIERKGRTVFCYDCNLELRKDKAINAKLSRALRVRFKNAIRNQYKVGSAIKDLGCNIEYLKNYLESKFYNNPETGEPMTWNNYGFYGWHIDHKKPLSSFDLRNRDDFLIACNYINLQPLWQKDNFKKWAKIIK